MANLGRRNTPRVEVLGADYDKVGIAVEADWRYELVMDFLKLSPSYRAVRNHLLGEAAQQLPSDFAAVKQVFKDFGDLYKEREALWWGKRGMHLYGITAPLPNVHEIGELNSASKRLQSQWQRVDAVVMEIPLALTLPQAMKQLRKLLNEKSFAAALPQSVAPKYQLMPSKLRIETLTAGVDALKYYKRGLPLWQIGNRLRLIPAQSFDEREANEHNAYQYSEQKELLSIAARRLIRTAVFVAENAARGRFPCDKPFAEAQMDYYRRKAGRPVGSTRAKRPKAGA